MDKNHTTKNGEPATSWPILAKAATLAKILDCSLRHVSYLSERGILKPISMGDRAKRFDVAESVERIKRRGVA
jgi:phage terminase Nu1 subunit (DNA packaging protein)